MATLFLSPSPCIMRAPAQLGSTSRSIRYRSGAHDAIATATQIVVLVVLHMLCNSCNMAKHNYPTAHTCEVADCLNRVHKRAPIRTQLPNDASVGRFKHCGSWSSYTIS